MNVSMDEREPVLVRARDIPWSGEESCEDLNLLYEHQVVLAAILPDVVRRLGFFFKGQELFQYILLQGWDLAE